MKSKILLVNPPIYDFSAYDFWLKPYGLLRVAGRIRHTCGEFLFDYLDRLHPSISDKKVLGNDRWGRGRFPEEIIEKPAVLKDVPRRFRRFGIRREIFQNYLMKHGPFDFALVQTVMTYWYLGVKEIITDIREFSPKTKIILGGVYASLLPEHALSVGADKVFCGSDTEELWKYLGINPSNDAIPFWEGYGSFETAVLKLTDGCPFHCSYCSVEKMYPKFEARSTQASFRELEYLAGSGVKNIAFYDDALLAGQDEILFPFLDKIRKSKITGVNFHTPNALNAKFLTRKAAEKMVEAGFRTFCLGFESGSEKWQNKTGGKVSAVDFERAVSNLVSAGAESGEITAYLILGHPDIESQEIKKSMRFVNSLGIRVFLSEFSPISSTPDGENCRRFTDLDEPLNQNKTAFSVRFLGWDEYNRLKQMGKDLNNELICHCEEPVGRRSNL